MGWSITPTDASIDENGNASFPKNTTSSNKRYTIAYSGTDSTGGTFSCETTYVVPICGCDCSSLSLTGKTDISKDGGSNIAIGTLSKASCMKNVRASSSEFWLSNLSVSSNDIKATVAANTSDERSGSVIVTVDKDGGGTCEKTMTIKQVACAHADETITIRLYRSSIPHHCSFFVMLDAELTDAAKEWVINSGYHYQPPSDIFDDITIGQYDYVGCDVSNFSTDCKYCSIKNGSYSNKKLEVGMKYYCYYYTSSQLISFQTYTMPSAEYCQEHVLPFTNICDVIWGT